MNNDTIITRSVVAGAAEVNDIIIDDSPRTRIVFRPMIHQNGIRGDIIRFRKRSNGELIEPVPLNFNQLNENDGVKIEMKTETLAKLYEEISKLAQLLQDRGVRYGENHFTVVNANALVITDENRAMVMRKLLESGDDFWNALESIDSGFVANFVENRIHKKRQDSLIVFEDHLNNDDWSEGDWQNFFEKNQWIFGYGLKYQILNIHQSQPDYGGRLVSGAGGQRGDFLMNSEADIKFTCLVEIKKPSTLLLQSGRYRNGVWGISNELSGAISQVQINAATWEIEGSQNPANTETMIQEHIYTVSPKGIVIVGKLSQLSDDRDKRNSFERLRQSLHNPEIITYDELYERAKFILGSSEGLEL